MLKPVDPESLEFWYHMHRRVGYKGPESSEVPTGLFFSSSEFIFFVLKSQRASVIPALAMSRISGYNQVC